MSSFVFPDKDHPVLIVGGGLAGCTLAWYLFFEQIPFNIFSYNIPGESSTVAAGLWNPVAARRVNPGWKMKECSGELHFFSSQIEKILKTTFYHPCITIHPFSHQEELEFWKKKTHQDTELSHIITFHSYPDEKWKLQPEYYAYTPAFIQNTGWMDVKSFLEKTLRFFSDQHAVRKEIFFHNDLMVHEKEFEYHGDLYSAVVFCEGWNIRNNPYFSFIKLEPAKGEILELESLHSDLSLGHHIINKGIFLMEKSPGKFVCGSTFEWDSLNDEVTEKARNELLGKLKYLIHNEFAVSGQMAGVRPATHDRRPFIGEHPEIKNMYVLNGLGTKGVFLIPRMCREFVNFMLWDIPLCPEVNILRRPVV